MPALADFVAFFRTYSDLLKLLDSALAAWPRLPESWDLYDEHLSTLDRHRAAVAALMTRHGIPDAGTAVANVVQGCAWAKEEVEGRPCPPGRVESACRVVVELRHPLCHLAELVRMDLAEWEEGEGGEPAGRGGRPKKGRPGLNGRLLDLWTRKPETRTWGARKLADTLGCAKSSIQACKGYQELEAIRAELRAEARANAAKRRH
jgi:hypothetical protein